MNQYDFSKKTNYLDRQMFLDPAGPVTVQRFEEYRYPKIAKYEKIARGFFWVPEEINLTQDKSDHKNANDAIRFMFSETLLRQTALDGLQGKAPAQIFTPVASIPELEALVTIWSFFETNIHSNSYSHIIRNIYNIPKDEFNRIHDSSHIIEMAASIGKYYDHLHFLNSKKAIGNNHVSEREHIKSIWLALHASYALESLRFLTSFAVSLSLVENRMFMGNGNIISLILQDELLHTEWSAYLINQVIKDDQRFTEIKHECEEEVYQMYQEVIEEEKRWSEHLFSRGVVVGLNTEILNATVDYFATTRLKDVGIKLRHNALKTNPIPWFEKHANPSMKQAALQEQESVSYIIGAMSSDIVFDELPKL